MLRDSLQLFCDDINSASPMAPLASQRKSVTNLLRDFDSPGVFPPSTRVDRSLKSEQQDSINLWKVWRYPIFAVNKGLHVFHHPLEGGASRSLSTPQHRLLLGISSFTIFGVRAEEHGASR